MRGDANEFTIGQQVELTPEGVAAGLHGRPSSPIGVVVNIDPPYIAVRREGKGWSGWYAARFWRPRSSKASREEFVDRATKWLFGRMCEEDVKLVRERMGLDQLYNGKSKRIHRLIRIAYLRGARRGAAAVWEGMQPISIREAYHKSAPAVVR